MASELGVQKLQHTNGTDAATINTSGQMTFDQNGSFTADLTVGGKKPGLDYAWTDLPMALMTVAGWKQSGSLNIPHAGKWLINAMYRLRIQSDTGFITAKLGSGSTHNGVGMFTDAKMLVERLPTTGSTFGNINANAQWLIDVPLGLSFPHPIYTHIYYQAAGAHNGNYNDGNGIPHMWGLKIDITNTSGTTVTEIS